MPVDGGMSKEVMTMDKSEMATVSGLRGHTMYEATVLARNGAGDGDTSTSHRFTTDVGVFPPKISQSGITTVQLQLQYSFTTEPFSDEYGPIR